MKKYEFLKSMKNQAHHKKVTFYELRPCNIYARNNIIDKIKH